jgi:hypothetical protein
MAQIGSAAIVERYTLDASLTSSPDGERNIAATAKRQLMALSDEAGQAPIYKGGDPAATSGCKRRRELNSSMPTIPPSEEDRAHSWEFPAAGFGSPARIRWEKSAA